MPKLIRLTVVGLLGRYRAKKLLVATCSFYGLSRHLQR